ncbi:thiol:disulfide interchange protein TlpA [Enterovirga rhinocerotis]|uniref:Thiol-disulfide isomerase/thioredoxin n=1 Tax=Enterovirga rhinocerotis TaxID=1339210 RepID=A0A4V3DX29_9HYPH|nr:TlpA disulfide reductase family protein [Enterovirga rhinocerotis]TDR87139.1 thiol-disulfide isomerase/thioredoxin [Enterovirga rhinocerotis]
MVRRSSAFRRTALTFAAALAVTGLGLYGTARLWGNSAGGSCSASSAIAARLAPLAKGEMAAFQTGVRPLPDLGFHSPDGAPLTLASFEGRTVLLNLWATWCEPCKREMPALDTLQGEFGGPLFEVAAVNMDTRNLDRPKAWLAEAKIGRLAYYTDHKTTIFKELRSLGEAEGLPTTVLVGPDGCKIGKLSGWAEWASDEGRALIRAALPEK